MLAATPRVFIEGYRLALEKAIPDRRAAFVLFWGMSTGGASLYPLARYYTPDGYLGWGTSSTGLAYVNNRTLNGNFNDIYEHSALRVRERGLDDFEFYTRNIDPDTRARWWNAALRSPRFKSTEDAAMQFGAAALTEHGLRLWQSDFLPAADRAAWICGFHAGDVRAELSAGGTEERRGARPERHQRRNAAAFDRRCEPEGDGALLRKSTGSGASKGCITTCSPRTASRSSASVMAALHRVGLLRLRAHREPKLALPPLPG